MINVEELANIPFRAPTPPPPGSEYRAKGKRAAIESGTLGGSSKRTQSDSTDEALQRLSDLRVQSNKSRARREE
ncbi:hypothetical protein E2562_021379 [Oryza meyeriana var. granulata]|uniref:Uncharacterized protein n=1 Tax=Oryza meyeriana var. granulata TaxID=110450 RepID=A0A6G1EXH7_9ORYZ|nr:hypothetical protein E2562_021379 [Oryza meyeriana var. granulata]